MLYHYGVPGGSGPHDLLEVAEFLGHRDLENTRLYISLEKNLFKNLSDDKFIIKEVDSIEQAVKLGEIGYEPFMVLNGKQLMRKAK